MFEWGVCICVFYGGFPGDWGYKCHIRGWGGGAFSMVLSQNGYLAYQFLWGEGSFYPSNLILCNIVPG